MSSPIQRLTVRSPLAPRPNAFAAAPPVNPASRNAGLQLAPQESSSIAGLRSLCFQLGTIAVVSLATAALAGAADAGLRQAWVYAAVAALLLLALPLVARVPEHHGAW